MAENSSFLDEEHEELVRELESVSWRENPLGQAFSDILRSFKSHMERENSSVVPLLKYLRDRANGIAGGENSQFVDASVNFRENYKEMLEEHKSMVNAIYRVKRELASFLSDKISSLTDELIHHIAMEEEVLYPAALAASDLIRSLSVAVT